MTTEKREEEGERKSVEKRDSLAKNAPTPHSCAEHLGFWLIPDAVKLTSRLVSQRTALPYLRQMCEY
ncbi:hypothetical protein STEG23_015042 [Scotinomys teguina]